MVRHDTTRAVHSGAGAQVHVRRRCEQQNQEEDFIGFLPLRAPSSCAL